MFTALEADDLKHRWNNCYVAIPKKNQVGIFLALEMPQGDRAFVSVAGNDLLFDFEDIEFKVPENQYVNLFFNKEVHGVYVYKTGARYFKKGFSLSHHGTGSGSSKMFDAVSPLYGKIRALNALADTDLFFTQEIKFGFFARLLTSGQITKSTSVHNTLATKLLLKNDSFYDIKTVLELVLNGKSLGLAISPQFFIGISSNEDYDAELYCGLIPVGFLKAKTKTIFVNGPIAQEVSDFLISSGQTEYEIISV